ncbi:SDR family NAD(P)-dependent oxidoreductase [Sphingobium fluviale]|uniref:Probable oxidoreductase n=1 Tax=Sphingobium fluviale TaxID=2506423 RepID=A0A4Q1KER7_9SPHN|nr:SDR family NAD(P)-dependent oxidoreductase [Sphingobium fluviale]RXR27705.1 SDR family NAD(P)-dependent oxidoreductase [Sphingobium fluviale]
MSEFDGKTTTDDVMAGMDLSGKRVLVTGVSAGLGVEIARAFVAHGADVVGTARNLAKGEAATAGVREAAVNGGSFDLIELDLASLASVRHAADVLVNDGRRFDIIIANAGVMATPLGKTADGFEMQFGTNHLGHFVLINRIAQLINDGGRVVTLSTAGHRFSDVDLNDPNYENTDYDRWDAYGRSKTATILFAVEFDRRHKSRGIRSVAVHPGAVNTDLASHLSSEDMDALRARIKALVPGTGGPPMEMKTVTQGAAMPVWAAIVANGDEVGGRYCVDYRIAKVADGVGTHDSVRSYALDPANAKALWAKSEEMVGENF